MQFKLVILSTRGIIQEQRFGAGEHFEYYFPSLMPGQWAQLWCRVESERDDDWELAMIIKR